MRILSLFNVKLNNITNEWLDFIRYQGFDYIEISPLQETKEEWNNEWWMLYQPINFKVGNRMGSKQDLINLCNRAKEKGINIIADVVVNHTAGGSTSDKYLEPHPNVDFDLRNNWNSWKHTKNIEMDEWNDRWKVINYNLGLPGLNPNDSLVQSKVIGLLNEYVSCGVEGFRIDAAKSIALPEEGCNFFPIITYAIKRPINVVYGEVLNTDPNIIKKYAKYMKVLTDVPVNDIKDSLVRFTETKDTYLGAGSMGYTKHVPDYEISNWYEGLANFYPNTLYYKREHSNEYGSEKVRKANKVLVR